MTLFGKSLANVIKNLKMSSSQIKVGPTSNDKSLEEKEKQTQRGEGMWRWRQRLE